MKRRDALVGLVAAAGLLAGSGTAFLRARRPVPAEPAETPPDLWTSTFQTPTGAPLTMASLAGRPLLLNFWATWCVPCVTEMPLLDAFARAQPRDGFHVLALAIDQREAVAAFMQARSIHLNVALGGAAGLDLSRSLGNSVGALPFSVAFHADGRPAHRQLGAVTEALLRAWAADIR